MFGTLVCRRIFGDLWNCAPLGLWAGGETLVVCGRLLLWSSEKAEPSVLSVTVPDGDPDPRGKAFFYMRLNSNGRAHAYECFLENKRLEKNVLSRVLWMASNRKVSAPIYRASGGIYRAVAQPRV